MKRTLVAIAAFAFRRRLVACALGKSIGVTNLLKSIEKNESKVIFSFVQTLAM